MFRRKEELCGYYYPRFAWLPRRINDKWIWFTRFYRKHDHLEKGGYLVHNIDEEEYCFLKISGKLVPERLRGYSVKSIHPQRRE